MKLLEIIKKMTESKKATYQGDITFSYYKLILMYQVTYQTAILIIVVKRLKYIKI